MYRKLPLPGGALDEFKRHVDGELSRVEQEFNLQEFIILKRNNAEPVPKPGMITYADGTDWDPGSGEGIYAYYGGAWHFLG